MVVVSIEEVVVRCVRNIRLLRITMKDTRAFSYIDIINRITA